MPLGNDLPYHREETYVSLLSQAGVARPVSRKEMQSNPLAMKAVQAEWDTLRNKQVWDEPVVKLWSQVCEEAREKGTYIHIGRIFGIRVEKSSGLPVSDPRRKFKYRAVFAGNNVTHQKWEFAMFQDLGSSPANTQAGKAVDCYACLPGHTCEQSDGEQAYVQAELGGVETWAALSVEAWPKGWYTRDGKPNCNQPVVRVLKAPYGHPDSGTYWETV